MDTAFLHSFVLTADTGSMSEAARRVGVTPAAVAQQVRALERELGIRLLLRAGRSVQPTAAGQRLLERARELLRELADLKTVVNSDTLSGELRLGTINTALLSMVPGMLADFVQHHPQVQVHIQSGLSVALFDAVQRGELDAAICLHPGYALPKSLAWELLREEPLVLLAPSRLAGSDPHALLRSSALIRYDRSLGGGQQVERYLRRAGIVPQERFELNSLLAIAMMVEVGLGVAIVPDIASPLSSGLKICKISLPSQLEKRPFGLVWQRNSPRGLLVKGLVASALAVVTASP